MPRIRSLKHDYFLDEDLAECHMAARILFAGLWVIADKAGRLPDQPIKIKAQILPYDNVDVNDLLKQLADRRMLIRYKVNDKPYIQIRSFVKHQKPHPKEAESEIPPPPGSTKNVPRQAPIPEGSGGDLPCVYFIQPAAGGPIKIGFAGNIRFRVSELQIGCPVKLAVLGVIPASMSKEKEIHSQFAHLRQDGEWFESAPELLEFIKANSTAVKIQGRTRKKHGTVEIQAGVVNGSGNGLGDLGSSVNGSGSGSGNGHSVGTGETATQHAQQDFDIWKLGVGKLVATGTPETEARSFLGGMRQRHGDNVLSDAITKMLSQNPVEPKAYLVAILQGQNGLRRGASKVDNSIASAERVAAKYEQRG